MIRVAVLYPTKEGSKFDPDYYLNKHIPLVKTRLGAALVRVEIDRGVAGGAPGAPAPYVYIAYLHFNSVTDFQKAFGPNTKEIMGDIPNYTNIQPVVQISEIVG
ncbi:MAG: EthD family reductase [Chloroflexi bacterium]|nr:EthD family reductase [Chloroflexota bacterium]